MIAFGPCSPAMATTREEDYPLYAFSGLPTHTSTYPSVYFQPQQTNNGFSAYNVPRNVVADMPSNYILQSQNSPKYAKTPLYSPTNTSANYFELRPNAPSVKSESAASMIMSATGSPLLGLGQHSAEWTPIHGIGHNMLRQGQYEQQLLAQDRFNYNALSLPEKPACVDPNLIQPLSPTPLTTPIQSDSQHLFPSPTPSSAHSNRGHTTSGALRTGSVRSNRPSSPYIPAQSWNPYPTSSSSRRQSVSSAQSHRSRHSESSLDPEENKGICPIASCGRHIKDLKAHLLTHKNERPEKCPIASCEYHIKGFARKYDKNRHTLTHYKGTMVCGFCPGSGSSLEKSFNRADVFKRHLTSVHGVEQTAPNARRRSGSLGTTALQHAVGITGICSTCGVVFPNVQDFYEHLDDCVLRVIQQGDPCEAINERILTSMFDDDSSLTSLAAYPLSISSDLSGRTLFDPEDDEDDEKSFVKNETVSPILVNSEIESGPHQGMTFSKGGVPLYSATTKNNKRRKNYPPAWNAPPDKTMMKKRVMCVFDGPRRLWKDDMMLGTTNHVRESLSGRNWVTTLDVQTLRRAEGIFEVTEEERGPWLDEKGDPYLFSPTV